MPTDACSRRSIVERDHPIIKRLQSLNVLICFKL